MAPPGRVPGRSGRLDRLASTVRRLGQPPGDDELGSEVGEHPRARRVAVGPQRHRALEQADRGGPVAAAQRPAARRLQVGGGPAGQRGGGGVGRADVGPQPAGLLEVVAGDLVELGQARPGPARQPRGEAFVQIARASLGSER